MASFIDWDKQVEILLAYATQLGYSVKFKNLKDKTSWIHFSTKEIVIHKSSTKELQAYDLIHELGHIEQQKNTTVYHKLFGKVFADFSKQSQTYKMKILEEELDAWNKGLKLSLKLGIQVNERCFEIRKASRVATYASWALK